MTNNCRIIRIKLQVRVPVVWKRNLLTILLSDNWAVGPHTPNKNNISKIDVLVFLN